MNAVVSRVDPRSAPKFTITYNHTHGMGVAAPAAASVAASVAASTLHTVEGTGTAAPAAVGGAGAGAPSAAVAPNPYLELWSNPKKLIAIFKIISNLTNIVYSNVDRTNVGFYMKGGNAIPLIKKMYSKSATAEFPSDFDLTLMINPFNPHISLEQYNVIQSLVLNLCIAYIIGICHNNEFTEPFYNAAIHNSPNPIKFQDVDLFFTGLDPNPNKHLNAMLAVFRGQALPNNCPFELFIRTNTVIAATVYDIGMIALRLRQPTGHNIELFDISFTLLNPTNPASNTLSYVKRDWAMTRLVRYTDPKAGLDVMIYDPFTAFVNMHIAARRNTRANKREKRLARANNLRNTFKLNSNESKPRRNATRKILSHEPNLANILPA